MTKYLEIRAGRMYENQETDEYESELGSIDDSESNRP